MDEKLSIIYVDDDEDDIFFFETVMKDIDVPAMISVCSSGIELVNKLNVYGNRTDVIFMDINMPLQNGFECLEEIQANHDWKSIPVFFISTSDSAAHRQKAEHLGAMGYIHKPSTFSELKDVLKQTISSITHLPD